MGLILLMTIPLFVEPINKFWHIGSYQAYPGRGPVFDELFGDFRRRWALGTKKKDTRMLPSHSSRVLTGAYSLFLFGIGLLFAIDLPQNAKKLATFCRTLWVGEEQWWILFFVFLFFIGGISAAFRHAPV